MRTTVIIRLLSAVLLLSACDNATMSYDGGGQGDLLTIAELKSRCRGNSTTLTKPITIQGTVTGNDRFGEFYKSLVIEDASGGITISIDDTQLSFRYPEGAQLVVYCNGLTLTEYGGKIGLGIAPDDSGPGRIPAAELTRYLRRKDSDLRPLDPVALTFDAVSQRHVDTFVCFEDVHFAQTDTWCDIDPETKQFMTTERTLLDARGRTLPVRTLGTCTYAKELLPEGTGAVCGIIDCFNGKYTLRITNRYILFPGPTIATLPTAYP